MHLAELLILCGPLAVDDDTPMLPIREDEEEADVIPSPPELNPGFLDTVAEGPEVVLHPEANLSEVLALLAGVFVPVP